MDALASPRVIGRYAIYAKIASGGMASVHFGRLLGAAGFSRTVAIKKLHSHLAQDPEFLSTMIDEAHLAARIHHPNVVPTLDVVVADGELLVVMEYVRGESLARLVRAASASNRRTPLPVVSAIAIGALHGLHAAHEATSDRGDPLEIVHRDVSPQNIVVGVDGVARVIDFGVAKAAGRVQITRDGIVKGKLAYMAPEQLLGIREVTRAADVYSMGVVLWEAITGGRLFEGEGEAELVVSVMAGAKYPPSIQARNVSRDLDALVMKALAPDPEDRFESAEEMAEALRRVVPPAFPSDVGRWVEEIAADALAERVAALAEIESSSRMPAVDPVDLIRSEPSVPFAAARSRESGYSDAPTVGSQPSLAMETPPRPSAIGARERWRPTRFATALGGAILVAGGITVLAWRGGGAPGTSGSGAQLQQPTAAAAPDAGATRLADHD